MNNLIPSSRNGESQTPKQSQLSFSQDVFRSFVVRGAQNGN
jgi:hypothetical protein